MRLSVVLPNYNHAHHLPVAIRAIFHQSILPDEVIIIDDASTDRSVSLIQEMQKTHPQIKLLQSNVNCGPVKTINRGIEAAQSKFLAFCSADDYVLPGFFEKALAFLKEHPHVGLCTGKTCHFEDSSPHRLIPDRMPLGDKPQVFSKEMLPKIFKKTTFFIHSNCALYRRKHILELGGLNPKLLSFCDWYMNCQIALHYGVGYIPSPFGAFRLSKESYAERLKSSAKQEAMFHALMAEIKGSGKEWENLFKSTGLLAQGGIRLVLFLAKHREYRGFFPRAFLKKCHFHLNKMVKVDDPLAVEDLHSILPSHGNGQPLQNEAP